VTQPAIPRKIHYCWLSGEPMPREVQDCMRSWQRFLPDHEIVRWDAEKFDMQTSTFARQAFERGKWAFASDYIRLFAVYTEGGLYFDSDVLVKKRMDEFLSHEMFIPMEYHPGIVAAEDALAVLDADRRPRRKGVNVPGIGLQAALFGARAGHPFLKACMDFYADKAFVRPDGSLFTDPIAPGIYAQVAESFGFVYDDRPQLLDTNVAVIESRYFASSPGLATKDSYAVHCCSGSWRDKPTRSAIGRIARKARAGVRRLAIGR